MLDDHLLDQRISGSSPVNGTFFPLPTEDMRLFEVTVTGIALLSDDGA